MGYKLPYILHQLRKDRTDINNLNDNLMNYFLAFTSGTILPPGGNIGFAGSPVVIRATTGKQYLLNTTDGLYYEIIAFDYASEPVMSLGDTGLPYASIPLS